MIIKYDKNNNPVRVYKPMVKMTDKWRKETAEEFRIKYGAWWLFQGVPMRHNRTITWIEQYRKKGV